MTVQYLTDRRLAEVRLNRPHRRNAITRETVAELARHLAQAEDDPDVGAVLILGNGGTFCSGLDLAEADVAQIGPAWQSLHRSIAAMSTPVVVAHEGAAVNAGAALLLAGDVVVSGESAFLQVMEARIGMLPPVNLAWLLHRHSRSLASRLTLSCDRMTGRALGANGIAHQVVADPIVLSQARGLAAQISEYPSGSALAIKRMLRASDRPTDGFDAVLDALLAG